MISGMPATGFGGRRLSEAYREYDWNLPRRRRFSKPGDDLVFEGRRDPGLEALSALGAALFCTYLLVGHPQRALIQERWKDMQDYLEECAQVGYFPDGG
jgi:hypothetical protein